MAIQKRDQGDFAAAVLDALSSHICVLDKDGVIVAVNRSWRDFARDNPPVSNRAGVGTCYLDACRSASGPGSEEAIPFAAGVAAVLAGETDFFQLEYPCHSPTERRWFLGRVTPLNLREGGAVVSHVDITDRKLLELELMKLAATDVLTGLPNRRFFLEVAGREIEYVRRFGVPTSLVMIDLDRFKATNDTYGHAAGDEALRSVADACLALIRKIDVLARFGGEEFILMLPRTDETRAFRVAEKLRIAIQETRIGDRQFRLTASFGVTEIFPDDRTIEDGLLRADAALYAAKRSGRNRVVAFSRIPSETASH
jgi:diguanylate cyclase (GGDEF)-like protein